MKLPAPPNVSEVELGPLSKNARKHFTTLRHYGEMWKAVAVRRGSNEVEFQNQISVLKSDNAFCGNGLPNGKRQLRELVIYRKICLFIQSETGRRFIETIFSVIATKKYGDCYKKVSWCKPLGLHQILHRVLQVKPERPSTHPGMVRTNSSSLLKSLFPFMPEIL